MNYDKLARIEEKLLDDVYIYGVEKAKEEIDKARVLYEKNIGSLDGFDAWSIFKTEINNKSIVELYAEEEIALTSEEVDVLEAWSKSKMHVYEAIDSLEGESILCRDIINGKKARIKAGDMMKKGDLFIGRILPLYDWTYASRLLSVFVDDKLTETVKGKFRESYESYCNIRGYTTYENYAENNQWIFYKIIEIIEKMEKVEEDETIEVYSAVYIVANSEILKEKINKMDKFILDDSEAGIEYYLMMDKSNLLCELELHNNSIVVNGNSLEELKRSQAILEEDFAGNIVFSESYSKKVEDLIE